MSREKSVLEQEIEEQASLLFLRAQDLWIQARSVKWRKPSLVVFAARGSSDHACLYARYLFEVHLKVPTALAAPSVVTRYGATPRYPKKTLVIGVSQSAEAPDVAEVLKMAHRQGCQTLAITNETKGVVVDSAQNHLFLQAGKERSVAATKTFSLTLLAFYQLVRSMGAPLREPEWGSALVQALKDERAVSYGERVARSRWCFSLGRGYHFAIACEFALKLMECARIPCQPYSLADFAHGPISLTEKGTVALVFEGAKGELEGRLLRKMSKEGAEVLRVPSASGLPEELRPIPAVIFAQRVAVSSARIRKVDPSQPRLLRKVTRTR